MYSWENPDDRVAIVTLNSVFVFPQRIWPASASAISCASPCRRP